jgi:hypothetical protein
MDLDRLEHQTGRCTPHTTRLRPKSRPSKLASVPPKKPPTLQLPAALADEIRDVAARAQRSVAFVVVRAIAAAKAAPEAVISGPTTALVLATDEEDPPNLLKQAPSAAALAGAWPLARDKFFAWIRRLEEAAKAESADDLDAALAQAADPGTPIARLTELSKSEYPKVRALVARHANTPADVIAQLAKDREPYVREAASARA